MQDKYIISLRVCWNGLTQNFKGLYLLYSLKNLYSHNNP